MGPPRRGHLQAAGEAVDRPAAREPLWWSQQGREGAECLGLGLEDVDDILYDLARALDRIFPNLAFDNLVKDHERLRKEQQRSDTQEKRTAVIEQMYALWFSTLGLDPETAALSREESQDLADYFYICELMIRCKESATRVSPDVWESLESSILTVPTNAEQQ